MDHLYDSQMILLEIFQYSNSLIYLLGTTCIHVSYKQDLLFAHFLSNFFHTSLHLELYGTTLDIYSNLLVLKMACTMPTMISKSLLF